MNSPKLPFFPARAPPPPLEASISPARKALKPTTNHLWMSNGLKRAVFIRPQARLSGSMYRMVMATSVSDRGTRRIYPWAILRPPARTVQGRRVTAESGVLRRGAKSYNIDEVSAAGGHWIQGGNGLDQPLAPANLDEIALLDTSAQK